MLEELLKFAIEIENDVICYHVDSVSSPIIGVDIIHFIIHKGMTNILSKIFKYYLKNIYSPISWYEDKCLVPLPKLHHLCCTTFDAAILCGERNALEVMLCERPLFDAQKEEIFAFELLHMALKRGNDEVLSFLAYQIFIFNMIFEDDDDQLSSVVGWKIDCKLRIPRAICEEYFYHSIVGVEEVALSRSLQTSLCLFIHFHCCVLRQRKYDPCFDNSDIVKHFHKIFYIAIANNFFLCAIKLLKVVNTLNWEPPALVLHDSVRSTFYLVLQSIFRRKNAPKCSEYNFAETNFIETNISSQKENRDNEASILCIKQNLQTAIIDNTDKSNIDQNLQKNKKIIVLRAKGKVGSFHIK